MACLNFLAFAASPNICEMNGYNNSNKSFFVLDSNWISVSCGKVLCLVVPPSTPVSRKQTLRVYILGGHVTINAAAGSHVGVCCLFVCLFVFC